MRHPNPQPRETSPPSVAFVTGPYPDLPLDDLDSHLAYPLHLGLPSSLSSPSSPSLPFYPFYPFYPFEPFESLPIDVRKYQEGCSDSDLNQTQGRYEHKKSRTGKRSIEGELEVIATAF